MCFADDDIKLNSTLFLWPDQIEDVFENSRNLLLSKRDQAELDLVKRYGSVSDTEFPVLLGPGPPSGEWARAAGREGSSPHPPEGCSAPSL